jgi:autoinducer 2-degrading protein
MPTVAIAARVRVKEGRIEDYLAAFAPLLNEVEKEPGTLVYLVQQSNDDPHVFWTSELYADEAAFAVHRASGAHADTTPTFTEVIADADVIIGEALMGKGIAR